MRKDLLNLKSRLLAEMGDASNILMFIGNQKLKKTGIFISNQNVSIFTILSSIRNFLYQEFNWRGYKGPGSFNIQDSIGRAKDM